MSRIVRSLCLTALVAAVASPAAASFWASDTMYVPAAAHNNGVEGSVWRTDLYLTNVDTTPMDAVIIFYPNRMTDNSGLYTRTNALSGREGEGFGFVNSDLADIPPGGTVVIEDILGQYWFERDGYTLGALVIWTHEAGSLDQDGGRVFRNALVQTRTYNDTTVWVEDPEAEEGEEAELIEEAATYGQLQPAVPWYNLPDPSVAEEDGVDFSYQILQGVTQNDTYRYNLGIFNSSDLQTQVVVSVQPFQADGTPFTDENDNELGRIVTIPPLAHVQYTQVMSELFDIEEVSGATLKLTLTRWDTSGPRPRPSFVAYGVMTDNRSNDPTTFLPSFAFPYDVDCMWPDPAEGGKSVPGAWGQEPRRPMAVPPR